jgi:flagellar basal-body rod modification protein FlgD
MTTLDALTSLPATGTSTAAAERQRLGQKDFIELMLAQFKNQDPLKPLDGTQFIGQLAQFSTVAGIEEMGASLKSLAESLRSDQMLAGAALVGRAVLVPSGTAQLAEEGEVRGAVEVPSGVTQVQVTVRDAAGQIVRQMTVAAGEGLADFAWDGITDAGRRAPAGEYGFTAIASGGGSNVSAQTLLEDQVRSVTLDAVRRSLLLNTQHHGSVSLADVRRIG